MKTQYNLTHVELFIYSRMAMMQLANRTLLRQFNEPGT